MPTEILMPALSPTMTEGKLAKWVRHEGDRVKAGDVLAEIETDKATMEVEAVDEGTLGKILIAEGTEGVAVNTPIAVLLEEGETAGDTNKIAEQAQDRTREQPAQGAAVEQKDRPASATGLSSVTQPVGKAVVNRDILYAQGQVIEPPPFDEAKFLSSTKDMTVREALREAMSEEMRADKDVFFDGRGSRRI